mmetsp:Transcript_16644/g.53110  ORF Transcript_16644/g.53110 Transcript_16644/m.53110 type:complete len:222 (-) Transcript_16644:162-827(-)
MLHVHLVRLVARKGRVQLRQHPCLLQRPQVVLVDEVAVVVAAAEEELVAPHSGRLHVLLVLRQVYQLKLPAPRAATHVRLRLQHQVPLEQTVLQEAPERRHAGAGADHDEGQRQVAGQRELTRGAEEHVQLHVHAQSAGHGARAIAGVGVPSSASASASAVRVAAALRPLARANAAKRTPQRPALALLRRLRVQAAVVRQQRTQQLLHPRRAHAHAPHRPA